MLDQTRMSDHPVLVPEHSPHSPSHSPQDFSPDCPFCIIAQNYGPISPLSAEGSPDLDSEKLDPPSFVLFSSEHVIAFLDIMPLTRGHVLVAPRSHRVKVGHLSPDESAEVSSIFPHGRPSSTTSRASIQVRPTLTNTKIGRVLPLLARSVTRAVMPDIPHDEADYNIVQNNGKPIPQALFAFTRDAFLNPSD